MSAKIISHFFQHTNNQHKTNATVFQKPEIEHQSVKVFIIKYIPRAA